MTIHIATLHDLDEWLQLALALWPDSDSDELRVILTNIHQSAKEDGFLVRNSQGVAIGFMNLSLRTDYVPGATKIPVAFLEGIYVEPGYQQQGIGYTLVQRAEQWARDKGCLELASDVQLSNSTGEAFHKKAGFEEVERVIQFIKTL
ncbi:aminoglycoside 6'-N-acetyltransferase [Spirosoma aerolatum]|uniref:aminoglycoside 6'-N-acetyltransferase n=1 Tax=Spirosoma aerolatum TaxID=1211326 RepID=UPI0009AD1889|nr:aminoglycoside 6'-N-acetyltransferase [Spirosoma aerolatum]